ncbi:MAG: beta-ketoacyl-[acyl-carrier-protein] synthase II [Chloroflexi bacterium RBG_16_57_11]|nr:MAG: beta-ketoacyl-[acyl-carrier-protein] synthase II [Chloroflexi bacterium RBG_16_57_11]
MINGHLRTRVVITGLGAITPLGASLEQYWDGLLQGRSGIRRITQFDASEMPCQIAGEVPDFNVELYMDRKEARRTARAAQFALAAAIQAVEDAGLPDQMPEPERSGVVYGTAVGGGDKISEGIATLVTSGPSKVSPFMLPVGIANISAFMIAHRFQCLGPNNTISTACATGTQAIGEAAELIRRGAADLVITGGTDALVIGFAIASFSAMHALPIHFNLQPEKASRPFDAKREGFILSEGAGALILESEAHAKARQARVYAEVAGHASSADAHHFAAPAPDGLGPVRAMRWALQDAGLPPEAVDYINAHGSSTPLNDSIESKAIKSLFGDHAYKLAVSSTKSMIGHPMGASGALEALACILAIQRGCIPPTINYEFPDPECDLDYVPNQARQAEVNVTLSNSFGLGGQNACLVLKKFY